MKEYYMLLGLNQKEIKIIDVKEKDGIIEVSIENRKKKVRCPKCNKFTSSVHGKNKPIRSKYLKSCEQKVNLIINKKRYHCYNCGNIFTEDLNINTENGNISKSLLIKIRKELLKYNQNFKSIAEECEVSSQTVINELKKISKLIPERIINLPRVISFDEFNADTNEGKYAFVLNDSIHKRVLDILPSRKKEYLIKYFTYCNNRHSVEFVISDMYEPYLLVTKIMFPKAKYVVDRFHYITYIMDALDKIRIRLQKSYDIKSKEYKILKNKKNVSLLRKYSNDIDWWVLVKRYKNGHMVDILPSELLNKILSISPELKKGYNLKEEFLDIINHATYETVSEQLIVWVSKCVASEIVEFIEAAGTISRWREYIVNSFIDDRYSNGFTEGINNKIKVIKRNGFGYRSFKLLRARILYIFNKKMKG